MNLSKIRHFFSQKKTPKFSLKKGDYLQKSIDSFAKEHQEN